MPTPLPKLSSPKTMGAAVTSSVIVVLILAQIAVKPAPKKPYRMVKPIRTGKESASLHIVRVVTAATRVELQARTSSGSFRSER